jgi:hypothetical protein
VSEKVELKEKISAVDQNIRELWDALDPEQQKSLKSEFFILNRYISNAKTNKSEIQQHFVLTVNEYFNKHWNLLQKHPKLMWMLLCMCSYDGKTQFYHEWIGHKKKPGSSSSKKVKFLLDLYPTRKQVDCELLADLMSDKEFKELALMHGMEDAEVKKLLK